MNLLRTVLICVIVGGLGGCDRKRSEYKTFAKSKANQTTAEGQYYLSQCYELEGDYVTSRKWLRKSAQQGSLDALFLLPDYYSSTDPRGVACGTDKMEQHAWLGVLAQHVPGCYVGTANIAEQIRMNREILKSQQDLNLSKHQLGAAKKLEAEYIRNYGCPK
ncbi:MAG: hypothetical protein VX438_08275 [Planctomycetota bacterium]|nr:hypothetical protein [Planctomycetota bacterium]